MLVIPMAVPLRASILSLGNYLVDKDVRKVNSSFYNNANTSALVAKIEPIAQRWALFCFQELSKKLAKLLR